MRFLLAVMLATGPFAAQAEVTDQSAAAEAGLSVRAISRLYRQAEPRSGLMRGFTGFPARTMAGRVARLERAPA